MRGIRNQTMVALFAWVGLVSRLYAATEGLDAASMALMGRTIERLLIVIVSGLSLYLGYRLFGVNDDPKGILEAHTGDKLFLKMRNIGPGVFFALFGSVVLVWVVRSPVDVTRPSTASGPSGPTAVTVRDAMPAVSTGGKVSDTELIQSLTTMEHAVAQLDSLRPEQRQQLSEAAGYLQYFKQPIVDHHFGSGTYDWWRSLSSSRRADPALFLKRLNDSQKAKFAEVDEFMSETLQAK